MVKFKSNIDCVEILLRAYNDSFGSHFNNITNQPMIGDIVVIGKSAMRDVEMQVIRRRWIGSDLEIELHTPGQLSVSAFERHMRGLDE